MNFSRAFCVHKPSVSLSTTLSFQIKTRLKGRKNYGDGHKINGQAVSVEVNYEVYEYLEKSKHKTENLAHQKRRQWDMREFDEYIIATECRHIYSPTPEEILCHRETMCELMAVLATCTEVQQERFLLYALESMSFSEIAMYCGCSKNAVMQSISAVRKKYQLFFK